MLNQNQSDWLCVVMICVGLLISLMWPEGKEDDDDDAY